MNITRRAMMGGSASVLALAALPRAVRAQNLHGGRTLLLAEAGSKAGALATTFAAEHGWEGRAHDLPAMLHAFGEFRAAGSRPIVGVSNYAAFILAQDFARSGRAAIVHASQIRGGELIPMSGTRRLSQLADLETRLLSLSATPGGTGTFLWAVMPA